MTDLNCFLMWKGILKCLPKNNKFYRRLYEIKGHPSAIREINSPQAQTAWAEEMNNSYYDIKRKMDDFVIEQSISRRAASLEFLHNT
jgi:hypothetical protein